MIEVFWIPLYTHIPHIFCLPTTVIACVFVMTPTLDSNFVCLLGDITYMTEYFANVWIMMSPVRNLHTSVWKPKDYTPSYRQQNMSVYHQQPTSSPVGFTMVVVYYESIKRELKRRLIYEYRCDERLKTKTEESTRLTDTGLVVELEHLKTKTS